MYIEKFQYPKVIDEPIGSTGRIYYIEHGGLIYDGLFSVTTIISNMSDSKGVIEEWRNAVGHKQADAITKKSTDIGRLMHDILYHRLVGTKDYIDHFKPNFMFHLASRMADSVENIGLRGKLSEVWGCEVPVFVPYHYGGRTDCVGVYGGKPSIVDFKNSYKDKKIEHLENYFIQCAAYAVAHDFLFNTNIEQCVILIANSSDASAKEVIVGGDEFTTYKNKWLDMVAAYCNK